MYIRKYWATVASQSCLPPRPPGAHHDPDPDTTPPVPLPSSANSSTVPSVLTVSCCCLPEIHKV
ncbi:hypothetical protein E2C01_086489 [Portunus trituberculatus]|uniref:Uncharacterized protein n=1 Tax=Portunus trituberculatus TaxID=210409 RepID=A0A5B7J0Y5_PORTR|nr:hypothetical protein [Portunus trituberculatus]